MFTRLFRRIGWMTALTFSWHHRGTMVRTVDLLLRLPALVRNGRTADAVTEARLVLALDGPAATLTDIRITGIRDGDVLLRGDLAPGSLALARHSLLDVAKVVDVRSDAFAQPTVDDALSAAPS
jgi:hypothetical protein